jgi:hypothetical protein
LFSFETQKYGAVKLEVGNYLINYTGKRQTWECAICQTGELWKKCEAALASLLPSLERILLSVLPDGVVSNPKAQFG